ncbi:MAG: 5-formyltetrahydrofolate cyclo-ligase [Clostridiales bacterium]|nr:5-formyltetrahydrofolate cyclo-ligase [Clostridiales bacterium]
MNKEEIRKFYKKLRDKIPKWRIIEKSLIVIKKFLESPEYLYSNNIMIYMSYGSEVNTHKLFNTIIKDKGKVILPNCSLKNEKIVPYIVKSFHELRIGTYKILEPNENKCIKFENKNNIDIILVPGIVFDKNGGRIGYGKGYYDKFLSDYNGFKIGLCFKEYQVPYFTSEIHDISVDKIICD